jgi:hypothetical protein
MQELNKFVSQITFLLLCICVPDIQSWWEVPSIAHFCSLFRTAFNLLDFDIEVIPKKIQLIMVNNELFFVT